MAKHKHSAAEVSKADLHQDDELHVTRTTPQGTQEGGVEKGHEQRDMKIREVARWFIGLSIGSAITIGAMWLMLVWLVGVERERKTYTSTPLYEIRPTVRQPELLPNPAQGTDQIMPWEHSRRFRATEGKELQNYGLADSDGRHSLPQGAVSAVMAEPSRPAASANLEEERPSEETGGQGEYKAVLAR